MLLCSLYWAQFNFLKIRCLYISMVIMWSIRKRKISLALSFKANMKPVTNLGRFSSIFWCNRQQLDFYNYFGHVCLTFMLPKRKCNAISRKQLWPSGSFPHQPTRLAGGPPKKWIIIISKNCFKNAGKDTTNDRNEKTTRF